MFTATRCYAGYKWSGLNKKSKRRQKSALIFIYEMSRFECITQLFVESVSDLKNFLM